MRKFIGERIKRNEDPRLLTGQALFVDDVDLPGMLHAAFLRSDYAHAKLLSIDITQALERPGVVAIYTAELMGDEWQPGPPNVSPPATVEDITFHSRTQVPLAKDKVRHVGESIAVVIAENRYIAEDAVEDILVEFEPLEVVADIEKALEEYKILLAEMIVKELQVAGATVDADVDINPWIFGFGVGLKL
jgi:CO/xanthine dehydrogenase Mo-binding subunit